MTRKLTLIGAVIAGLAGCQSVQGPQPQKADHPSQSVYEVEFYAAHQFAASAEKLKLAMGNYCQQQTDNETVRNAWRQTMTDWMALQGQERGPANALKESWNVEFWPDKKDTTGHKMRAFIQQDRSWSESDIAAQSVTVQGLGAIEWLLYDQSSPLAGNRTQACPMATAIAENLATKAGIIATEWRTNPWLALDSENWEAEYIALLSNQLDYTLQKLSRPMAKIGQPRPYFSESWRSKTSLDNLKANVAAMEKLYLANGQGLDQKLRDNDLNDLADRVKYQYDTLLETWPSESSLFDLLQNRKGYQQALSIHNKLEQLKYLLHDEVAVELGVAIGFNATDGD